MKLYQFLTIWYLIISCISAYEASKNAKVKSVGESQSQEIQAELSDEVKMDDSIYETCEGKICSRKNEQNDEIPTKQHRSSRSMAGR